MSTPSADVRAFLAARDFIVARRADYSMATGTEWQKTSIVAKAIR
jgi:hypothetical protein